jgi:hypothetical protein
MKNDFTLRRSLILATILSLAGLNSFSQIAPPPPGPRPVMPPGENQKTFDLVIRDGTRMNGAQYPATIENLVEHLRQDYPDVNFVLTPGARSMVVENLELHSVDVSDFMKALEFATDGAVRGNRVSDNTWALLARNKTAEPAPDRQVEVFNLTGYLHNLGKTDDQGADEALHSIAKLVADVVEVTMRDLHEDPAKVDHPSFQVHPGANLLIVVGSPRAIDITRKVVSALPGQQMDPRLADMDRARMEMERAGIAARLQALRSQLAEIRSRFSADNPQVRNLQAEIEALENQTREPGRDRPMPPPENRSR